MSDHQVSEDQPHLASAEDYEPPNRAEIIAECFEAMRAGSSLDKAALRAGRSPATVWRWINADESALLVYDQLKVQRSRAFIEHAVYEIQEANTIESVKIAERKAKYYLMMAAKLNPKEFSDRMHSPTGAKNLGSGRVSFVLNIGQQPTHHKGELTVIEQPEDGD